MISGTTVSRGKTFADLGFKLEQAAELQIKAELTRQIYNRIKGESSGRSARRPVRAAC